MSKKDKKNYQVDKPRKSFFSKYKFIIIPILSVLIPATLYVIGFSYHSGKLNRFGINNEFFQRSAEYYFLQGYFISSNAVFSLINYGKLVLFITVAIWFSYFYVTGFQRIGDHLRTKKEKRKEKKKNNIKHENKKETTITTIVLDTLDDSLVYLIKGGCAAILTFLFILSYYVVFGAASSQQGVSSAEKVQKEFSGCDQKVKQAYDCIFLFDKKGLLKDKGYFIASNGENIAIWTGEKAKRYSLNDYEVEFLSAAKKSTEVKDKNNK